MATIETLGEIRGKYNFWNEKERPYYEALSEAIRVLNAQKDKHHYAKIVRCGECKWWDKRDDSPYGYCHACKHGHYSEHWEISIYRLYKADWFCADGEWEVQE